MTKLGGGGALKENIDSLLVTVNSISLLFITEK